MECENWYFKIPYPIGNGIYLKMLAGFDERLMLGQVKAKKTHDRVPLISFISIIPIFGISVA